MTAPSIVADTQQQSASLYPQRDPREGTMRRREFITLLGGAPAAWPLASYALQLSRPRRIGFLTSSSRPASIESSYHAGFLLGMRELGYVEGKDFIIEWRFAEGRLERFADFATELVQMDVDVLVPATPTAIRAVRQATRTIPIVMVFSTDPVGNGFVASLAHPGGIRLLSPCGILRGQDIQGREASRPAGRAAHTLVSGDQPQDSPSNWDRDPGAVARSRRRGDRMSAIMNGAISSHFFNLKAANAIGLTGPMSWLLRHPRDLWPKCCRRCSAGPPDTSTKCSKAPNLPTFPSSNRRHSSWSSI
jgi:ABC transporter substrate binding protein